MSGVGSGTPPPDADDHRSSTMGRLITTLGKILGRGERYPGKAAPEFSSFEEAERAAYRASTTERAATTTTAPTDAQDIPIGIDHPEGLRGAIARPAGPTPATSPEAISATVARLEDVHPASSSAESIPSSTGVEAPGVRSRRRPGDTAPESLLRTPPGAAAVANDFFDALVRRVEGDR